MPIISAFFGIIIRMYFKDTEQHHLPHFHAKYGDNQAVFDFDGNLLAGTFPPSQTKYVVAWAGYSQGRVVCALGNHADGRRLLQDKGIGINENLPAITVRDAA
ncbi:MAG: DUF4160 domain-containing protein [Acidobacteriota bacterium]|nr:DUF4160 domain-containing protein [Acidobacteriota bacterium]